MSDTARSDIFTSKFAHRMQIDLGDSAFPAGKEDRVLGTNDIIKARRMMIDLRNELDMMLNTGRANALYASGAANVISYFLGDIHREEVLYPDGIRDRDKIQHFKIGDVVEVQHDGKSKSLGFVVFDGGPCPYIPSPYHTRWYSRMESTMFTSSHFLDESLACLTKQYIVKIKGMRGEVSYAFANHTTMKKMDYSKGISASFRAMESRDIQESIDDVLLISPVHTTKKRKITRDIVVLEIKPIDEFGDISRNEEMNDIVRCMISSGVQCNLLPVS